MSRSLRRSHRARAVRHAVRVYRLWWRRCTPPSEEEVQFAARRLADNLACSNQRASARELRAQGYLRRHEARADEDYRAQLREVGYA